MKRTIISALIIVFLSCQYSFAACSYEHCFEGVEDPLSLTQEEAEEIYACLLSSIDCSNAPNQWDGSLAEFCLYFIGAFFSCIFVYPELCLLYAPLLLLLAIMTCAVAGI